MSKQLHISEELSLPLDAKQKKIERDRKYWTDHREELNAKNRRLRAERKLRRELRGIPDAVKDATFRRRDFQRQAVAQFIPPELICASTLGWLISLSVSKVWELNAKALMPSPIRLGSKSTLWRRREIVEWVDAGCPPRTIWENLKNKKEG